MPATDLEVGPHTLRPKSLTASSLLQRAGIGLLILVTGIAVSVLLYDASITQSTLPPSTATSVAINR